MKREDIISKLKADDNLPGYNIIELLNGQRIYLTHNEFRDFHNEWIIIYNKYYRLYIYYYSIRSIM